MIEAWNVSNKAAPVCLSTITQDAVFILCPLKRKAGNAEACAVGTLYVDSAKGVDF